MVKPPKTDPLSRRDLLLRGAATTAGLVVLSSGLGGCEARPDTPPEVITGIVNIGPETDFPAGIVNTKHLQRYGIAVANDSGTVLAIHPRCPHKGCVADWKEDKNQFICPCHDSHFNLLGRVIKGPATKGLPAVTAIRNADGTLSVDLDRLYHIDQQLF